VRTGVTQVPSEPVEAGSDGNHFLGRLEIAQKGLDLLLAAGESGRRADPPGILGLFIEAKLDTVTAAAESATAVKQTAEPYSLHDLTYSLTDANEDLLRRDADVAVRMAQPTQNALVAKRVGTVELGVFAREDYLANHPVPRSATDLLLRALVGAPVVTVTAIVPRTASQVA
jgi:hypothetical protein